MSVLLQENQFYSYRSRINRGGALKAEDAQGAPGVPARCPPQGCGTRRPRDARGTPLRPPPRPSRGARSAPAARFAQTGGFSPKTSPAERCSPRGAAPRKAPIGPQKATPSIPAGRGGVVPSRAAPVRPHSRREPVTRPPPVPICILFPSPLSAGGWLKSIGFPHDFIVFFFGSGK